MTYEKPEALQIGSAEDVVLGVPKQVGNLEINGLPRDSFMQIAEVDE